MTVRAAETPFYHQPDLQEASPRVRENGFDCPMTANRKPNVLGQRLRILGSLWWTS